MPGPRRPVVVRVSPGLTNRHLHLKDWQCPGDTPGHPPDQAHDSATATRPASCPFNSVAQAVISMDYIPAGVKLRLSSVSKTSPGSPSEVPRKARGEDDHRALFHTIVIDDLHIAATANPAAGKVSRTDSLSPLAPPCVLIATIAPVSERADKLSWFRYKQSISESSSAGSAPMPRTKTASLCLHGARERGVGLGV